MKKTKSSICLKTNLVIKSLIGLQFRSEQFNNKYSQILGNSISLNLWLNQYFLRLILLYTIALRISRSCYPDYWRRTIMVSAPPSSMNGLSSFCHGQQEEKPTLGHTQPTKSRQDSIKTGKSRAYSTNVNVFNKRAFL